MNLLIQFAQLRVSRIIGNQAILVVIGDGINSAFTLVSLMIISRVMSVDNMGTYRQTVTIITFLSILVEFGFSGIIYRYWNFYTGLEKIVFAKLIIVFSFILGGITSLTALILALILPTLYNNSLLLPLLLMSSLIPVSEIPLMVVRPILISEGHSIKATLFELLIDAIKILSLLIPLILNRKLLEAILISTLISTLRLILLIPFTWKYLRMKGKIFDQGIFKTVWDYFWPLQLARLPGLATTYIDKILSPLVLSTTDYAIYNLGAREIPFVGNVCFSISNVLVPQMIADYQSSSISKMCKRFKDTAYWTAIFLYPITAYCIYYSKPIMNFLFSESYAESSVPFSIFASLTFIRVLDFGSFAKAIDRTELILKAAILGAGSSIIFMFPLGLLYKTAGFAFAVSIGTILAVAYFLNQYKKILSLPLNYFFPWKSLIVLFWLSFVSVWLADHLLSTFVSTATTNVFALGFNLILTLGVQLALFMPMAYSYNRIKNYWGK